MAFGDVVSDIIEVAAGEFLVIQPPADKEWMIANILVPNGVANFELYATDGTNDILLDVSSVSWTNNRFFLTNTHYLKVKNTATTAQKMGYNGIELK